MDQHAPFVQLLLLPALPSRRSFTAIYIAPLSFSSHLFTSTETTVMPGSPGPSSSRPRKKLQRRVQCDMIDEDGEPCDCGGTIDHDDASDDGFPTAVAKTGKSKDATKLLRSMLVEARSETNRNFRPPTTITETPTPTTRKRSSKQGKVSKFRSLCWLSSHSGYGRVKHGRRCRNRSNLAMISLLFPPVL